MKLGLIVVLTLLVAAFTLHFFLEDPGYVVIDFRSYVIETSVPVLVVAFAVVVFAGWLLVKILRAPRRLGQAAGRYRSSRAGSKLTKGMIQIAEGNFARGEKLLVRAADVSDAPLLNYLQAARAAHLLGQERRRDDWLKRAYEQTPEAANAVLLTQAEFQLDQQRYESALATLRRIEDSAPKHSQALALLGRLYFQLEDWAQLEKLLPRLRRNRRLDQATLDLWSIRVYQEELAVAADEQAIERRWTTVPKELKKDERLLKSYYEALVRVGAHRVAEKALTGLLRRRWLPSLVEVYGRVDGKDSQEQLKQAESWLDKRPDDPVLLLTVARLCLKSELWGKARSYLETLLSIQPSAEVYQEYGRLLNQLGEGDAAAEAYREGLLMIASPTLPAIPHLPSEPEPASDRDANDRADDRAYDQPDNRPDNRNDNGSDT